MVNKKYFLTAGLLAAMAVTPAFAQESAGSQNTGRDMTYRGQVYDALDSAYVPARRMEQQRQYLNHEYAFPAKPRNMWEVGVAVGQYNVLGDVNSKNIFNAVSPIDAMGFSAWVRKAMGYSASWRVQYVYGRASGYDHRLRDYRIEKPWKDISHFGNTNSGEVYSNYKTQSHELTLQLVGNIHNIRFHKAKNTLSLYGFVGAGAIAWNTQIAVKDANGNYFDFEQSPDKQGLYVDRKDHNKWYRDQLKGAETVDVDAESTTSSWLVGNFNDGKTRLTPVVTAGLGMQVKLGDRVSLQFENKFSYNGSDELDAVTMDPNYGGGLSPDKDFINYFSVGLGFNLGKKDRYVQPLWWVNPADHLYNELADPRHMNMPPAVLLDSDGDGVADIFDKCPDTPAGVAVDTHGCPLDTDGDGVPDYLDKEKITPTRCQPVDADGVGKCPEEDCCDGVVACNIMAGSIDFAANSTKLNTHDKSILSTLAAQMKANPSCKVVISGNQGNSKLQQQRSWERVNAIINYMTEVQNINRNQFIFHYQGTDGNVNSVQFRAAMPGEEGPTQVAPPHPQLGSK